MPNGTGIFFGKQGIWSWNGGGSDFINDKSVIAGVKVVLIDLSSFWRFKATLGSGLSLAVNERSIVNSFLFGGITGSWVFSLFLVGIQLFEFWSNFIGDGKVLVITPDLLGKLSISGILCKDEYGYVLLEWLVDDPDENFLSEIEVAGTRRPFVRLGRLVDAKREWDAWGNDIVECGSLFTGWTKLLVWVGKQLVEEGWLNWGTFKWLGGIILVFWWGTTLIGVCNWWISDWFELKLEGMLWHFIDKEFEEIGEEPDIDDNLPIEILSFICIGGIWLPGKHGNVDDGWKCECAIPIKGGGGLLAEVAGLWDRNVRVLLFKGIKCGIKLSFRISSRKGELEDRCELEESESVEEHGLGVFEKSLQLILFWELSTLLSRVETSMVLIGIFLFLDKSFSWSPLVFTLRSTGSICSGGNSA